MFSHVVTCPWRSTVLLAALQDMSVTKGNAIDNNLPLYGGIREEEQIMEILSKLYLLYKVTLLPYSRLGVIITDRGVPLLCLSVCSKKDLSLLGGCPRLDWHQSLDPLASSSQIRKCVLPSQAWGYNFK